MSKQARAYDFPDEDEDYDEDYDVESDEDMDDDTAPSAWQDDADADVDEFEDVGSDGGDMIDTHDFLDHGFIERDESDSELDMSNDDDDGYETSIPLLKRTRVLHDNQDHTDPSPIDDIPYDKQFSSTLLDSQARLLKEHSNFNPPSSSISGLSLRSASVIQKNIAGRAIRLVPHAHRLLTHPNDVYWSKTQGSQHVNNEDEEDADDMEPYEADMSLAQLIAQDYQISSDRLALGATPLPGIPPSSVPIPIDEYGEAVIAVKTTTSEKIPLRSAKGKGVSRKTSRETVTITTTTPVESRLAPSFEDLGFKQRFVQHLLDGIVSSTVYKYLEALALRYKSKPQSDFEQEKAREITVAAQLSASAPYPVLETKKQKRGVESEQLSIITPSFQAPIQALLSPLLSSYCDVLYMTPTATDSQTIWDQPRDSYLCHVLNHVFVHRDRITAHNEAILRRLTRKREASFLKRLTHSQQDEQRKLFEERKCELESAINNPDTTSQDKQQARASLVVLETEFQRTQRPRFDRVKHRKQRDRQFRERMEQLAKGSEQLKTSSGQKGGKRKGPSPLPAISLDDLQQEKGRAGAEDDTLPSLESEEKYRDQGFVRPCVLIIQPTRCQAYETVMRLLDLVPPSQRKHVHNLDRFHEEYGDADGTYRPVGSQSLDYQLTFKGNTDDCFRLGLQFAGNTVKLFSPMYHSDIIVASPLSLKLILGGDGSKSHARKADFLTSIQLLVIDQLHMLSMQNLDHLTDVLCALNGFPTNTKSIDFSRVRQWYLDGHARFYRQTVMLTAFLTPQINNIYNTYCENKSGRIRLKPQSYPSVMSLIKVNPLKQVFYRIDQSALLQHMVTLSDLQTTSQVAGHLSRTAAMSSIKRSNKDASAVGGTEVSSLIPATSQSATTQLENNIYDAKFTLWCQEIWPKVKESYQTEGNTVIFVPSSLDFVRVRNEFYAKFVNFTIISEYTDARLVDNARSKLLENKVKFALVSERYYFYFRASLKNIRHIVWYGPPTIPHAYSDLANMLRPAAPPPVGQSRSSKRPGLVSTVTYGTPGRTPSCFVVYSQHDALALERVVGTEKCRELLMAKQSLHVIGS